MVGRRFRVALASSYGLAGREVERAFERGIDFFFWGALRRRDFGAALRRLARHNRGRMEIAVQTYARRAALLGPSVDLARLRLGVDTIDVLGLGFWAEPPPRPIVEAAVALRERGVVKRLVVSSHDRRTLVALVEDEAYDAVMARYNAAHPGAEREVFPIALDRGRPILAYTATRWGTLVGARGARPTGADCYRFVLSHPAVSACLAAPKDAAELDGVLEAMAEGPLSAAEIAFMRRVGETVRRVRASAPRPTLISHARAVLRELLERGITEELLSRFLR
jgi:aryl-alcohol dehydrogenase-like predicted oxidoreductase